MGFLQASFVAASPPATWRGNGEAGAEQQPVAGALAGQVVRFTDNFDIRQSCEELTHRCMMPFDGVGLRLSLALAL